MTNQQQIFRNRKLMSQQTYLEIHTFKIHFNKVDQSRIWCCLPQTRWVMSFVIVTKLSQVLTSLRPSHLCDTHLMRVLSHLGQRTTWNSLNYQTSVGPRDSPKSIHSKANLRFLQGKFCPHRRTRRELGRSSL